MKARATAPFLDLRENVDRRAGELFECSEERFEELNATMFGTLAERVDEKPARKPARRRKAAPKAGEGQA